MDDITKQPYAKWLEESIATIAGIDPMRLIAKFKTHLHKEYGDAIEDIAKMFDTLYAEQQKETPLMWYEYCYGVKDTGK